MRTNLAERLGYEPEESTEERQARLREAYQMRKAMRRLARLGCCWLSGVACGLRKDGGRRGHAGRRVDDDVLHRDMPVKERKITIDFRPDQLADVIEAVNAYADDLKNDRALLCEMPRVDHETTDELLKQETRLQKLAYWLLCVQDEAL